MTYTLKSQRLTIKLIKALGRIVKRVILVLILLIVILLILPEKLLIPVKEATSNNWDSRSFWYYPWSESVVHKGVDIFVEKGRPVVAPTYGLILSTETTGNGGNTIKLLGPKLRVHYFAHLDRIDVKPFKFVTKGEQLGIVGNTGNATSKLPHLHYSIYSCIPLPWYYDEFAPLGHLKMFYLNPIKQFGK